MYLLRHDLAKDELGDDTAVVRGQPLRAAAVADLRLTAPGAVLRRDVRATQ